MYLWCNRNDFNVPIEIVIIGNSNESNVKKIKLYKNTEIIHDDYLYIKNDNEKNQDYKSIPKFFVYIEITKELEYG